MSGLISFCHHLTLIIPEKILHLNFSDDGVQVLIPFSKTDQTGQGCKSQTIGDPGNREDGTGLEEETADQSRGQGCDRGIA